MNHILKKIVFFGCPMDCDEKYDSILEKQNMLTTAKGFDDPLDGVIAAFYRFNIPKYFWKSEGSLPVPSWLGPNPGLENRSKINTREFISFIDGNGCKKFAEDVDRFVSERILPHIPCMIAIDHSLTGGVYSALARFYGKTNLSLIVIDSHTDAIPMAALAGAIQYDIDNNPSSFHDAKDPFLYNRPDSYNACSFLHSLVADEKLEPKNLYIVGVSDYPEKKFLRIKDPRIQKYTRAYTDLKRKGVSIITKKECKLNPRKIKDIINKIATPYVYVSIDMDIGANNALGGVRFRNWEGLDEAKINKLADHIAGIFSNKTQLAGMDVCEIDPRRAGSKNLDGRCTDRTYDIAAALIQKIAFS